MSASALLVMATLAASGGDWATPAAEAPLASEPGVSLKGDSLRWSLSLGGLLSSAWYVGSYRTQVDTLRAQGLTWALTGHQPEAEIVAQTIPVVGPWVILSKGGPEAQADAALLAVSGGLQALGLATLTYRLLTAPSHQEGPSAGGLELSFSPVAAGRLGLTICLTGW